MDFVPCNRKENCFSYFAIFILLGGILYCIIYGVCICVSCIRTELKRFCVRGDAGNRNLLLFIARMNGKTLSGLAPVNSANLTIFLLRSKKLSS